MEGAHEDGNSSNNRLGNLTWKTHADNMDDRFRHGTVPMGQSVHCSKITEKDVLEIRELYAKGSLQKEIASAYGTGQANISSIVLRKTWKHI